MFFRFIFILFLGFTSLFAEKHLWYSYTFAGKQVGYFRSVYRKKKNSWYKKKFKFRKLKQGGFSKEESAVLAKDFTLRSLYISENHPEKGNAFIIITVSDSIVIQREETITTLAKSKFYLEPSDFLRHLVYTKKLQYGKLYRSKILETNQKALTSLVVRYLGKRKLPYTHKHAHTFKVTTGELKSFWAKATVDMLGNLIGYELGKFNVLRVSAENALQIRTQYEVIPTPLIYDCDHIQKFYLQFRSDNKYLFRNKSYQRVKKNFILLKAIYPPVNTIQIKDIFFDKPKYLRPSKLIPAPNTFILKHAKNIRAGNQNAVIVSKNIARWVHTHIKNKDSAIGKQIRISFGMSKYAEALTNAMMLRANGIPSRLVSGLYYRPGKFIYTTWAEAYLKKWIPIHRGKLGGGARFLNIYPNTTWTRILNLPRFSLRAYRIIKDNVKITFKKIKTCISLKKDIITDHLLGVKMQRPADWVLLSKNIASNLLVMRSLKGKGPAIIIRVFLMEKPLEEILRKMGQKILSGGSIEILWKQARKFHKGQALEVGMKSLKGNYIYRVFVAQRGNKGIFAMLIVPIKEIKQVEQGFQKLIDSIKFLY